MTYSFKIFKNNKTVEKCLTHSKRIFLKKLRTISFQENDFLVYVKVSYGKGFINEGEYSNKDDLWVAIDAFLEK